MISPVDVVMDRYEALREGDFARIYWSSHPESTLRRSFRSLEEYLLYARTHLQGALTVESVEVLLAETDGLHARLALHVIQHERGRRSEILERVGLVREQDGWQCRETARVMSTSFPNQVPEGLSELTWEFFDHSHDVVNY